MSYETEKAKCAEIFRNDDGLYSFICYDCGKEYHSSDAIIKHIEITHFPIEDFNGVDIGYKTKTLDIKPDDGRYSASPQTVDCFDDEDVKPDPEFYDSTDNNIETNSAVNIPDTTIELDQPRLLQIKVLHRPQFECDICGKTFRTKSEIQKHFASKNHDKQSLRCEGCARQFTSNVRLENHRKREILSDQNQPHCQLCNETFAMQCQYKHHFQAAHQDDATNTCLVCEKSFTTHTNLLRHSRQVHIDDALECDICHAQIRGGKGNLKQHRKTRHTDSRPFECNVCKKSFKFASYVRLHMRFHEKEKQYQCTLCGKNFYTVAVLNEHIKSHTNARRFKCGQCYKKFMTEANLRKHHTEIHAEAQLVPCELCGKMFRSRKTLRQHLSLHSEVKRYQCRYCDQKFAQFAGQRSHEKNRHKYVL